MEIVLRFKVLFIAIIMANMLISSSFAGPMNNGDTQVALLSDYKVQIGLQYRVMYNCSNIPNSVVSQPNTVNYDFFRQRMRFNIDVQPEENVGGFMQLEYRKIWGSNTGSSIPYNRLDARGVRYGYIYYQPEDEQYMAAGIIPVSDQLGDTLFSADWDFNVGGLTYNGLLGSADYRVAFVRVVDSLNNTSNVDIIGEDANFYIGDINLPVGDTAAIGGHIYYLNSTEGVSSSGSLSSGVKINQAWYALSGSVNLESVDMNGFVCLNDGDFGATENTGLALKGEAITQWNDITFKGLLAYSSGDKAGTTASDQFRTPTTILGTEGYWAYTHIFTANGPSDVNDLAVDLANGGRGLGTFQAKASTPLTERLDGEVFLGYFQSSEDNAAGNSDMGTEIGFVLNYELAKSLNFQFGAAVAFLGDYYKVGNTEADDLNEVFGRFQLQF